MAFNTLLISLLATLVLEVPIAVMAKIPLSVAILVNVLTNPLVVTLYLWARAFSLPLLPVVLLLEVCAILAEAYFYRDYHPKPLTFSLCINLFSYTVGALVFG